MTSANNNDVIVPKHRSLFANFVLGALACCGAVTVSNPMEVVKTRLQLQGELQRAGVYTKQYKGLTHAFFTILKKEGIPGIQKGLFLAYPYTTLMNGTRLSLYEHGKRFISNVTGVAPTNVFVGMTSGALSGIVGSTIANPFYIAKTRLQSYSPQMPVGHQHAYNGALSALIGIYRQEGLRGLFNGTKAACIRISVASPTQLVAYDVAKRNVIAAGMTDGLLVHIISSVISGAFLVVALNPFDVITTRMYNQKTENGKGTLYKGWLDCATKVLKTEGMLGMYKGLIPHYARIAPHTIMIFVLLEQLKKLADALDFY